MPIELLYIVPILALAVLAFRLVFLAQKRAEASVASGASDARQSDSGAPPAQRSTEDRLNEYERTIAQINKALSSQQEIIQKSREENSSSTRDIEKLNAKLRELHKEYDIVISENYSLRAKVKSMENRVHNEQGRLGDSMEQTASPRADAARESMEMNMSLYEDTKVFKASSLLDDTNELDVDDVG